MEIDTDDNYCELLEDPVEFSKVLELKIRERFGNGT